MQFIQLTKKQPYVRKLFVANFLVGITAYNKHTYINVDRQLMSVDDPDVFLSYEDFFLEIKNVRLLR